MQTNNRLFDDFAKVLTGAAGAAQGVRSEAEEMMRAHLERAVSSLDLVPREEFDAVKAMAVAARDENARLEARIAELETRLGASGETTADSSKP
jgi:BMFP domain-containing protein YqiC